MSDKTAEDALDAGTDLNELMAGEWKPEPVDNRPAAPEQCRPCAEGAFKVSPNEDVPLCQGHWNAYLDMFATGGAPCNAHLINA